MNLVGSCWCTDFEWWDLGGQGGSTKISLTHWLIKTQSHVGHVHKCLWELDWKFLSLCALKCCHAAKNR